jgi:hypothetical protein
MPRALLVFAFLAVAGLVPAQDLPPYELPADVAQKVRSLTQAEPLELLAALASLDLQRRAAAEARWAELDARAQCALVRAGLRAADPEVAIGAAAKAESGQWLDTNEQKRAATVGMGRCNVVDTPFDVAEFFQMFDAKDTALFLANPGEMPREVPQFFGILHHRFGPEHQAQVELLTRSDDVLVRQDAAKYFGVVKLERTRYAHFLLSQPLKEPELPPSFDPTTEKSPFVPRSFTLRAEGEGYPALLAAVLERVFLTEPEVDRGLALFAWRWATEATPGEIDRELMPRLLRCDSDEAQRIGLRILQQIGGDEAGPLLSELADKADGEMLAPLQGLRELVRRGDAGARLRLVELARSKSLALTMLWQCAREEANAMLKVAFGAEAEAGRSVLAQFDDAAEEGDQLGEPMVGLDEALRERAAKADLEAGRLASLLEWFPAVRSPALCSRAIGLMTPANLKDMPLGVLELADRAALAQALHRVLATEGLGKEPRELAIGCLANLGKPGLGDAAQAEVLWQQLLKLQSEEDRGTLQIDFAEVRDPAWTARLRAAAKDETWYPGWETAGRIGALTAAGGIDKRLAFEFANTLQSLDIDVLGKLREDLLPKLLAGDGAGAIESFVRSRGLDEQPMDFLWLLPGKFGREWLQRYRDEREHGLYAWATGELSRAGDPDAKAEVESAIARRLYGWIDEFTVDVLTDGKSLERVPLLLQQVDSNCCTFAVVGSALEDTFEVDAFESEYGLLSRPELLKRAWDRCQGTLGQGKLAWSNIASKWLIAPK